MKYKVGDVVLIKEGLKGNKYYDCVFFNKIMEQYCGREATITYITDDGKGCRLDIDDECWYWNEAMLSDFIYDNFKKFVEGVL